MKRSKYLITTFLMVATLFGHINADIVCVDGFCYDSTHASSYTELAFGLDPDARLDHFEEWHFEDSHDFTNTNIPVDFDYETLAFSQEPLKLEDTSSSWVGTTLSLLGFDGDVPVVDDSGDTPWPTADEYIEKITSWIADPYSVGYPPSIKYSGMDDFSLKLSIKDLPDYIFEVMPNFGLIPATDVASIGDDYFYPAKTILFLKSLGQQFHDRDAQIQRLKKELRSNEIRWVRTPNRTKTELRWSRENGPNPMEGWDSKIGKYFNLYALPKSGDEWIYPLNIYEKVRMTRDRTSVLKALGDAYTYMQDDPSYQEKMQEAFKELTQFIMMIDEKGIAPGSVLVDEQGFVWITHGMDENETFDHSDAHNIYKLLKLAHPLFFPTIFDQIDSNLRHEVEQLVESKHGSLGAFTELRLVQIAQTQGLTVPEEEKYDTEGWPNRKYYTELIVPQLLDIRVVGDKQPNPVISRYFQSGMKDVFTMHAYPNHIFKYVPYLKQVIVGEKVQHEQKQIDRLDSTIQNLDLQWVRVPKTRVEELRWRKDSYLDPGQDWDRYQASPWSGKTQLHSQGDEWVFGMMVQEKVSMSHDRPTVQKALAEAYAVMNDHPEYKTRIEKGFMELAQLLDSGAIRDMKPGNVLVDQGGFVWIDQDFGTNFVTRGEDFYQLFTMAHPDFFPALLDCMSEQDSSALNQEITERHGSMEAFKELRLQEIAALQEG